MEEIKITKKEQKELFVKALFASPYFTVLASVLTTFIIAAVFFRFSGPVPLSVTSTSVEKVSSFDVTGEGEVSMAPDEAEMTFGLEKSGSSVAAVQTQVNETINNFKNELKKLGIEEKNIKTVEYSMYPEYDYRSDMAIRGYKVSTSLMVRFSDFSKLNEVVDLAGKFALNRVGSVSFQLSEEKEKEAMSLARKEAIEAAKEKAEELASLSGVKLGKIVNVVEGSSSVPVPLYREAMTLDSVAKDKGVGTEVSPGESTVRISVTLSYETK